MWYRLRTHEINGTYATSNKRQFRRDQIGGTTVKWDNKSERTLFKVICINHNRIIYVNIPLTRVKSMQGVAIKALMAN